MLQPNFFQPQCTCVILCIHHALVQGCVSLSCFVGFISTLQVPQNKSCIKINNDDFFPYIVPGCWGLFYNLSAFSNTLAAQMLCLFSVIKKKEAKSPQPFFLDHSFSVLESCRFSVLFFRQFVVSFPLRKQCEISKSLNQQFARYLNL